MLLPGLPDTGTMVFYLGLLAVTFVMVRPGTRANRGTITAARALASVLGTL
jgi:hypothetical protein